MKHRVSLPVKRTLDGLSGGRCNLRRKIFGMRLAGCLTIMGAALALTPNTFAQTSKPSEAAKTQDAAATLSHDLSGVWMQYPDGPERGVPGMNAIDERFRPPFAPWGQARFDAARPMQGPTAA